MSEWREYLLLVLVLCCFLAGTIGLPVTSSMVLDLYRRLDPAAQARVREVINEQAEKKHF